MRKLLSIILSMCIILSLFVNAVPAADNAKVSIENKVVEYGTTDVSVDVVLSGNPGMAMIITEVEYDSNAMTLDSVTNGTIFGASDLQAPDMSKNPVSLTYFTTTGNVDGNGTLATLNFKLKADCPAGEYLIKAIPSIASDINEVELGISGENGSITVKEAAEPTPDPETKDNVKLEVVSTSVEEGADEVSVNINMSDNTGIALLIAEVSYDSTVMTLNSVNNGSVFSNSDFTEPDLSKNPIKLVFVRTSDDTSVNGNLITLKFKLNSDCPVATYPITLNVSDAADINEDIIDTYVINGSITVEAKPSVEPDTQTTTVARRTGGGGSSSTIIKTTTVSTTETSTETSTETITIENTEITTESNVISNDVKVKVGSKSIEIGGKSYIIDAESYIQTSSNSTMVPLRFVAIAINGGSVENADSSSIIQWKADTKTAVISTGGSTVEFTAYSNIAVINGVSKAMNNGVEAEIVDGRMYIPFRALGEALGVDVSWDSDTRTAIYSVK